MSDDLEKYSQQLRQLVDDYYHQQLTVEDYRTQRKLIFDRIEQEFTGGSDGSETLKTGALTESTLDS